MRFLRRYWPILLVLSVITALEVAAAVVCGGWGYVQIMVLIDALLVYLLYRDHTAEEDES